MPLPPYIHRDDREEDRDRYQTVFSHEPGSAAAPTAGLHFTPEILDSIRAQGVEIETVTLHVGLGTFQPVRAEMVKIFGFMPSITLCRRLRLRRSILALKEGRRMIAAGTTTTRTLEHCAQLASFDAFEPHGGASAACALGVY